MKCYCCRSATHIVPTIFYHAFESGGHSMVSAIVPVSVSIAFMLFTAFYLFSGAVWAPQRRRKRGRRKCSITCTWIVTLFLKSLWTVNSFCWENNPIRIKFFPNDLAGNWGNIYVFRLRAKGNHFCLLILVKFKGTNLSMILQ